jgi:hypothetical protein
MNNEANEKILDKKELMKEKRELKRLERFMYDRESTLRNSTRQISKQNNYYSEIPKGVPKIDSDPKPKTNKTKKKSKNAHHNGESHKNGKPKNGITIPISDALDDDTERLSYVPSITMNRDSNKNEASVVSNNENSNKISLNFNKSYLQLDTDVVAEPLESFKYDTSIRERVEKEYSEEVKKYHLQKDAFNESNLGSKTFINCDLRFFNFDLITSRIGHFDVIMLDPPWRIKGGQRNDSSFMFSNSKFNLEYNTLSNNEIISLPVEKLSRKGMFKYNI